METTAAFRLSGNATLTAAAVTQRLGIEPTCAFETGPPASNRSAAIRQGSLWLLASSPAAESGTELAGHLHRLLAILEPATAAPWELVHAGYDANWLCYIASHATRARGRIRPADHETRRRPPRRYLARRLLPRHGVTPIMVRVRSVTGAGYRSRDGC